jgi:hypothetical protein
MDPGMWLFLFLFSLIGVLSRFDLEYDKNLSRADLKRSRVN